MKKQYIIYGGTKYKAVECICENCGKKCLVGERWLKRSAHHYCCQQCAKEGRSKLIAASKQAIWQATEHYCEKCGKLMLEKFGSGRFCSRSCANQRIKSAETKQKIRKSVSKPGSYNDTKHKESKDKYEEAPKTCVVCKKVLPYDKRKRVTCSKKCYRQLISSRAKINSFGGLTTGCGGVRSKKGYYKGIRCESSYELIYLVYCLENKIKIERNTKAFNYTNVNGEVKKYYPDFYLPETNTYIELKGYKDKNVDLKLAAVEQQGYTIKIFYKQDLLSLLEYINNKFKKMYTIDSTDIVELYDK